MRAARRRQGRRDREDHAVPDHDGRRAPAACACIRRGWASTRASCCAALGYAAAEIDELLAPGRGGLKQPTQRDRHRGDNHDHQHPSTRRAAASAPRRLRLAARSPRAARSRRAAVKFILPNATGSGVDAITRAAQPALAKALGASRSWSRTSPAPAASSACRRWRARRPTARRCRVVSNNVVIFPSVYKSLPFDMPGDFTPIAVVGSTPIVLVVNPPRCRRSNAQGVHRAAQGQAGRAQLRLGRQRHHPAPGGRDVPRRGRRQRPRTSPTRASARWSPT